MTPGACNSPFLWLLDHFHELTENALVSAVYLAEFDLADIAVTHSKLDVHLRLSSFAFGVTEL